MASLILFWRETSKICNAAAATKEELITGKPEGKTKESALS